MLQVRDLYDPRTQWASYIANAVKVGRGACCVRLAPALALGLDVGSRQAASVGVLWLAHPGLHPSQHYSAASPRMPRTPQFACANAGCHADCGAGTALASCFPAAPWHPDP